MFALGSVGAVLALSGLVGLCLAVRKTLRRRRYRAPPNLKSVMLPRRARLVSLSVRKRMNAKSTVESLALDEAVSLLQLNAFDSDFQRAVLVMLKSQADRIPRSVYSLEKDPQLSLLMCIVVEHLNDNPAEFFQRDSFALQMTGLWLKIVSPRFVHAVFGNIFAEFQRLVDSSGIQPTSDSSVADSLILMFVEKILSMLLLKIDQLPFPCIWLLKNIRSHILNAQNRSEISADIAVSRLLFSNFVCCVIHDPVGYGVMRQLKHGAFQSFLTKCAKLLHNVSEGILFHPEIESKMAQFNDFVQRMLLCDTLQNVIERIIQYDFTEAHQSINTEIPRSVILWASDLVGRKRVDFIHDQDVEEHIV
eukprot:811096_1